MVFIIPKSGRISRGSGKIFPAPLIFNIPVLFAVIFLILLASMPLYQKVQKQLDRVLLKTRENLLGVRVISVDVPIVSISR